MTIDEAWAALEAELVSGWEIWELHRGPRGMGWRVILAGPFISFRRDAAERTTYDGPEANTPQEAFEAIRERYVAWRDWTGG